MNLRRGLFRLWLVGSALFVLAVAFVSYGPISDAQLMDAFYKNFYNDLTREEFDKRMASAKSVIDPENFAQLEKAVADIKVPNPWASVGTAAAIAFGIPLVVLALGSSLLRAMSGLLLNGSLEGRSHAAISDLRADPGSS